MRVNDLRRVGREGKAGDEVLKDRMLLCARRRVDLVDRKVAQPLDGWNVVVGSCPIGQPVGDSGRVRARKGKRPVRASGVKSQAPKPFRTRRLARAVAHMAERQ